MCAPGLIPAGPCGGTPRCPLSPMTDLLDPRQSGRRSAPTLDPSPRLRRPVGRAGARDRPGVAYRVPARAQDRARARGSSSLRRWLIVHRTSLPIVLGLLLVGVWVLGTGIRHYPAFADDEGTYVAQAWAMLAHGSLSHYTYWYDHPPLGWLQLAFGSWLFGPLLSAGTAVAQARSLMLVPGLVSVALVYVLARRLGLRRAAAAGATVLFTCNPLSVALLRQVYLDSVALPWLLASLVLALSPSRRLWAFAGSGLCFAIAVLTKETMLIFLPAVLLALIQTFDRRTRAFCLTAFVMALLLVGIGYPLYALLKGELLPGPGHVSLLQAVEFQLYGRPGTGSVLSSGSAAHQLVSSWLQTDPWLLGAGVCAVPFALLVRQLRPVAVALLIAVLVALRGAYLPQPFVIAMLPFCALAIAGVLDRAAGRIDPRRPVGRIAAGALAAGLLGLAVAILPGWRQSDSFAMSNSETRPLVAAERWVQAHVDRRARLLVDDTMYVDLVQRGFAPRFGVVWFYKLDFTTNLDPLIVRRLPKGWREFDYVVSTPVIRSALSQEPAGFQQVRLALAHSQTVAQFGSGTSAVQIRRLVGVGVGSGLIPPGTPAPGALTRTPAPAVRRHPAPRHSTGPKRHGAVRHHARARGPRARGAHG